MMNLQKKKHFRYFYVNGRPIRWREDTISYSQLVHFAIPPPPKNTIIFAIFTVQFSHGPKVNPSGTLIRGQFVKVKSNMVFDVTRT